MRTPVTVGDQTAHINLDLVALATDGELELPGGGETAVVVLTGRVDAAAAADGASLGTAGGRASVFEGPGDTVYAPPGTALRQQALEGGPVQLAIASAAAEPDAGAPPGFHPVVAASGYSLYYLWVMAGDGREMMPYLDPAHAWVQQGR